MRATFILSLAVGLGAIACGARTGLGSLVASDDAGQADATKPHDASTDAPAFRDATPPPDAPAPVDASTFFCTPGTYYVEVTDDAGTRKLSSPCPNGGFAEPSAAVGLCGGEDPPIACIHVSACGGGGRIDIMALKYLWVPPGSSAAQVLRIGDAGNGSYPGSVTIYDWPGAGGTVAGDYDAGPISGKFCVRQQ